MEKITEGKVRGKMKTSERIELRLSVNKIILKNSEKEEVKNVPHINWLKGKILAYEGVLNLLGEKKETNV